MGKPIAHVQPLIPAHAWQIGALIEAIEYEEMFEVVADKDERGSFTVELKGRKQRVNNGKTTEERG